MIADYWIVKKRELDVPDLYRTNGRYAGVSVPAVIALLLGVVPNLPGFLQSTHLIGSVGPLWEAIYPYAWFTGFLLAGGSYLILVRLGWASADAPTTARLDAESKIL
jgi:NCS1 family nucleobase:cation symporter-1